MKGPCGITPMKLKINLPFQNEHEHVWFIFVHFQPIRSQAKICTGHVKLIFKFVDLSNKLKNPFICQIIN